MSTAPQYDLYGGVPPHSNRSTSLEAALSIKEDAKTLRAKVLRFISGAGGATCDEAEESLGMRHQTASARVRELAITGDIIDRGRRRLTRSGRKAIVWEVA